jgi:hypothetical protein
VKTLALALLGSFAALAGPVVWQSPATLAAEDKGPPAPPYRFVKEEMGGTNPKVIVRDAKGVTWYVKFGFESKPETFASRVVRATGYYAPVTYYVAQGVMEGLPAGGLKRADKAVEGGSGRFRDARFAREMKFVDGEKWSLDESSIHGTKELSGLKLMILLTANWDVKPQNFAVVQTPGQPMFAITDWGQTLGAPDMKSHWDCEQYRNGNKVLSDGVENDYVYFRFGGKQDSVVTNGIRVEHVRWWMTLVRGFNEARVRKMLLDSGATPEEAACFAPAFMQRIGAVRSGMVDTE